MPEQMTTQVTASTEVARTPPVPGRPSDPMTSIYWVVGGIVLGLGLLKLVLDITGWFLDRRAKDEEKDEGELEKLGAKVTTIEATCRDFMPRSEIVAGFKHQTTERESSSRAAATLIEAARQDIGELGRGHARLQAQFEGQADGLRRIEQSVERLGIRMDDKLDRLATAVGKA